ncbi:MAG TPA: FAD:protein FMN transferase [Polyangiales bacterium]|nr:FAD:protein FMN transferase [Polyangiales bacterium]
MKFFARSSSQLSTAPAERRARQMGTLVQQRVYGIGGERACAEAHAEIARLEALWSVFREDSEICQLARCAGRSSILVHEDTFAVLAQAMQLHGLSGGAFDITAGPLLKLWRQAAQRDSLPEPEELAAARALVGIHDLVLGPGCSAQLGRKGQSIDLGAIGKGYAADRCLELYRQQGVRHALIDLGGNVAALGCRPDGAAWRVGIQAPGRPRGEWFGYLEVTDSSIVTSGSYERGYEVAGQRYSHVLDPRTGVPVSNAVLSATVMADSSTFADGLSTACLILGVERSLELANALGAEVLLLDEAGVHATAGIAQVFHAA